MKFAYDRTNLHNLLVTKSSNRWMKQGVISKDQLSKTREEFPCTFYHPNMMIRILLFVVSVMALSGVTGILAITVLETSVTFIASASIIYGLGSLVVLENLFIKSNRHYKSGINEALIYHSVGFILGGVGGLTDFSNTWMLLVGALLFVGASVRYLDLISTGGAVVCMGGLLFTQLYELGGVFQALIPIVFAVVFTAVYFINKSLSKQERLHWWKDSFMLIDYLSLIIIYLSVNYLIVRELSIELMNMTLENGQDIPLALLFYVFTIGIPLTYLYFGIRNKDMVLIRISLLVIAFAAFTFKHYFIDWSGEIFITIAGFIMIGIAIVIMNYLKVMKNGFTREMIEGDKWLGLNAEAFTISQTLGGNAISDDGVSIGKGGEFGGGGASGKFWID